MDRTGHLSRRSHVRMLPSFSPETSERQIPCVTLMRLQDHVAHVGYAGVRVALATCEMDSTKWVADASLMAEGVEALLLI